MKHTLKVTVALVAFFLMAQFTGLLIVNHYIDHKKTAGTKAIEWQPLPYGLERPEIKNQSTSFIYITIAILIGTILVLLLVKFNKPLVWKLWFFATVWLTLSIALAAFLNNIVAAVLALIVAILKLYRPNVVIQNLSEIFIYGGLAAIFVPVINVFAAFMLLVVISIYDFIAVYKTGHMVKLARFQSKSRVFAGLLIPYSAKSKKFSAQPKTFFEKASLGKPAQNAASGGKAKIAVLGGGDIGFTLIFAGVVMKGLMLQETVMSGFLKTLPIPVFAGLALLYLLLKGRENKFYPAMPILSIGCFTGYLVVLLL
ncbi:hypothetical protein HYX08_05680 [Candidatus Woesearchaeota archaeon]|nr:hypothetical protein [Candidatus Woesearchaeota archaeon]